MEVANILENKEQNKIYGLIGNINLTTNNNNIFIIKSGIINNTVKAYLNNPKASKSLKLVMLNENYLDKNGLELSCHESSSVMLAKALIENKEVIVLDHFDKDINNLEKENFKRLFKKIVNDTNKTILIYTSDLTFLWDICDNIIEVDNHNVINIYEKKEYYNLITKTNTPIISEYINIIRNKGIKIEDYKDVKDLLKAIYRIKEKEQNALSN